MWIYLGLFSALFYGIHNLFKKHAVKGNEVFPVLFGTSMSGLLFLLPLFILSKSCPSLLDNYGLLIPELSIKEHFFIFFKSLLMALSWVLSYQALKHLPITIVTPIRAAGPFFTLIGAMLIYRENPNAYQWLGFFIIMLSVILYSKIGKKEGINFKSNKWIYAIIGATFFGSASGLYDKFLIQNANFSPQTVQFWFSFYVVLILIVLLIITWLPFKKKRVQFKFRWSIIGVGFFIQIADYIYFKALQDPEALIMILSAVKRSQIIISVIIGGLLFKEKNKRKKLVPLFGILIGVALILYAKS